MFKQASAFNGDLDQWDVASVIDMSCSKSIFKPSAGILATGCRLTTSSSMLDIVENALT